MAGPVLAMKSRPMHEQKWPICIMLESDLEHVRDMLTCMRLPAEDRPDIAI